MFSSSRLLALLPLLLGLVAAACAPTVLGQPIAAHGPPVTPGDFDPPDDVAVLHYYGVGGWGILWKGSYLLAAPYFSNHGYLASSVCEAVPDEASIRKGFASTPYRQTSVILVGHGHVDHAGDIPAYPFTEMSQQPKPTLVADESTMNLLGDATRDKVCPIALSADSGNEPLPTGECKTPNFRVQPLPWAHAPHVGAPLGIRLMFGDPQGTQDVALPKPPDHGGDWLVGRTWAYRIELLDEGKPVFRILYVDSAANPNWVGAWAPSDGPTDVHIACVPGFDVLSGYPDDLLRGERVKYVLAGHWEDFFRDRDRSLRPVAVLDGEKMSAFARRVQATIPADDGGAPINKSCCEVGKSCGPFGPSWTVPLPGETFWFRTGRQDTPREPSRSR